MIGGEIYLGKVFLGAGQRGKRSHRGQAGGKGDDRDRLELNSDSRHEQDDNENDSQLQAQP